MKPLFRLLFALAALLPAQAAQEDRTLSPYFWVKSTPVPGEDSTANVETLPLKATQVDCTIAGVIADVRVTQTYANTGKAPIEAVYLFPGSTRAAVHGLTMTVGERRLEARIKKRDEARKTYEEAKSAGKTTSLLEQQRPNVFQMNIANIMPGDEVRVELRYTELLVPTAGIYEFTYPGVVGPRYSNRPEKDAAATDKWVANPHLKKGQADPASYKLSMHIVAGLPLQDVSCRTHSTNISYDNDHEARISTLPEDMMASNRDFICSYRLAGGAIQSGLILAEGKEENFFLLMVQPPARPHPKQIPPRDFIFIVDVSGSMNGFPLNISKKLMRELFSALRPEDSFNVLLFAGDNQVLSPTSLPASEENINKAIHVLDQQNGGGGTELLPALKQALALPKSENTSRCITVITDGYVDVEAEAFELVRSSLGQANLFAFGIGSAVNRHLIEGLARVGQGEPFFITEPDKSQETAARFISYISTPVLTRVAVDFGGLDVHDAEPKAIPDVLAERPVIIFGKWRGKREGKLTVRGISGDRDFVSTHEVADATLLGSVDGLSRLWARSRIAQLGDLALLEPTDERALQITNLGLTYNLLTKYTSFVAVDETIRRQNQDLHTVKQPLPLPQGVENTAVGDEVPTSPEPSTIGLLGIGCVFALFRFLKRGKAASGR